MVWESLMRTVLKAPFTLEEHFLFLKGCLILSAPTLFEFMKICKKHFKYWQNAAFVCLRNSKKCKELFLSSRFVFQKFF